MRVFAALLLVLAAPLAAQSTDVAGWVSYMRAGTSDADPGGEIDFGEGSGYGVSLNHFWTRRISTELSVSRLGTDEGVVRFAGVDTFRLGELELMPITATVQFHCIRHERFDAYVGAGAAHVSADDLESADLDALAGGPVEIDSATGWTAQAGGTFFLTNRIGIAADAKYLSYSPESAAGNGSEPVELELDPWIFSAGIRIRF